MRISVFKQAFSPWLLDLFLNENGPERSVEECLDLTSLSISTLLMRKKKQEISKEYSITTFILPLIDI